MHDSRDTRERYYFLLLLLLIFIHSFIHSFMYLAEGTTGVILGPRGLPTIVRMLVVVLAIFLALVL